MKRYVVMAVVVVFGVGLFVEVSFAQTCVPNTCRSGSIPRPIPGPAGPRGPAGPSVPGPAGPAGPRGPEGPAVTERWYVRTIPITAKCPVGTLDAVTDPYGAGFIPTSRECHAPLDGLNDFIIVNPSGSDPLICDRSPGDVPKDILSFALPARRRAFYHNSSGVWVGVVVLETASASPAGWVDTPLSRKILCIQHDVIFP